MRLSAWPLALGLAFATPSFAADADSSSTPPAPELKRPRVAAPT